MKTECTKKNSSFQVLIHKEIVMNYSCGTIVSDGGGILLREVEKRTSILEPLLNALSTNLKQQVIKFKV